MSLGASQSCLQDLPSRAPSRPKWSCCCPALSLPLSSFHLMTWWHDDMMTWWHDDMMTWCHDNRMTTNFTLDDFKTSSKSSKVKLLPPSISFPLSPWLLPSEIWHVSRVATLAIQQNPTMTNFHHGGIACDEIGVICSRQIPTIDIGWISTMIVANPGGAQIKDEYFLYTLMNLLSLFKCARIYPAKLTGQ